MYRGEIWWANLHAHILYQYITTNKSVDLRVPTRGTPTQVTCRGALSCCAFMCGGTPPIAHRCLVVFLCGGSPRIKTPLHGYPRISAGARCEHVHSCYRRLRSSIIITQPIFPGKSFGCLEKRHFMMSFAML